MSSFLWTNVCLLCWTIISGNNGNAVVFNLMLFKSKESLQEGRLRPDCKLQALRSCSISSCCTESSHPDICGRPYTWGMRCQGQGEGPRTAHLAFSSLVLMWRIFIYWGGQSFEKEAHSMVFRSEVFRRHWYVWLHARLNYIAVVLSHGAYILPGERDRQILGTDAKLQTDNWYEVNRV